MGMNGEKRWLLSVMAQGQAATGGTLALSTKFSILTWLSRNYHWPLTTLKVLWKVWVMQEVGSLRKLLLPRHTLSSKVFILPLIHHKLGITSQHIVPTFAWGLFFRTPMGPSNQNPKDDPWTMGTGAYDSGRKLWSILHKAPQRIPSDAEP